MPGRSNWLPGGLLDELELAVETLRERPTLLAAARQLRERAKASDGIDDETRHLMKRLQEQLEPLAKLQKIVEDLDPHTLTAKEFNELWPKGPKALIQDAVESGRFRERRILLQAKEAMTNRWLAWAAFFAALVALAVPVIEKVLGR